MAEPQPSALDQAKALEALQESLRRAREQYVSVRNTASAAQWKGAKDAYERQKAQAEKKEQAVVAASSAAATAVATAVGTTLAVINSVPIIGQVVTVVVAVAAALAYAGYELGKALGKVEREPPPPLPSREGYECYRGFDKEAFRWMHSDADLDTIQNFEGLVYRRLWALHQLSGLDILGTFPELERGKVVHRPYLFDGIPEVSEVEAAEAAAARERPRRIDPITLPAASEREAAAIYPYNIAAPPGALRS